jgi:hypothetical protein
MAECWTVGVKAGIDAAMIVKVFNEAALGHMMSLKVRLPATYLRGDFDPRFSLELARKDLGLALELARASNTPMRLGALCEQEMIEAMGRGWANRDASIFLTFRGTRERQVVCLLPEQVFQPAASVKSVSLPARAHRCAAAEDWPVSASIVVVIVNPTLSDLQCATVPSSTWPRVSNTSNQPTSRGGAARPTASGSRPRCSSSRGACDLMIL